MKNILVLLERVVGKTWWFFPNNYKFCAVKKNNETSFYPYGVKTSKCCGSFNNIDDPYAKLCIPNVVKNINLKVFNLMSRANGTRYIKLHETCKCKCRSDASVFNNKQRWNEDKYRFECKELIDKGVCDKWFIWNPSNCECE